MFAFSLVICFSLWLSIIVQVRTFIIGISLIILALGAMSFHTPKFSVAYLIFCTGAVIAVAVKASLYCEAFGDVVSLPAIWPSRSYLTTDTVYPPVPFNGGLCKFHLVVTSPVCVACQALRFAGIKWNVRRASELCGFGDGI